MNPYLVTNTLFAFLFSSALLAEPALLDNIVVQDNIQSDTVTNPPIQATGATPIIPPLSLTKATGSSSGSAISESLFSSFKSKDSQSTKTPPPNGVSKDWWNRVQRGIAKSEYHTSKTKQGLQAPNRSHNLRTYFEPTGIRLHDRTAAGSPKLTALSLAKMGRGEILKPVAAGILSHTDTRVEIRRPGVIEWYENTAQGLEQGFTLPERTEGQNSLVLELVVKHAKANLHEQSIVLATDTGRRLRYSKLIAKDAAGKILISHMEVPSPLQIRLIVDDTDATYPLVIDPLLTAIHDKILQSNDPDVNGFDAAVFGGKVASAGDVNGDGFPDVIVGARGFDTPGLFFDEGAAFVFLGSATGIVGSDPATAHAVIMGDQGAEEFGTSVSGAGDVNGDGFGDIIVGAPFYEGTFRGDPTLSVKGAAFVFYGGPSGITATSPAMADARIDANQVDSILGFSVAGAGDVNADGFDDIIVGAPRQGSPTFPPNIPPNQAQGFGGAAAVFHGSASGITATGFDDADAILLPYPTGFPEPSGGFMGSDVAGAGDVNGDGFDDVLVFIDGAALFLGSAAGIVGTDPTTAHTHISGLGFIVSAAGDVNSDGFGDIILGAPGFPQPDPGFSPTNEGAFGIFLGSPTGIPATDFSQAQTLVSGNTGLGKLGFAVAAAGDIDNDGFDDVIVGAQSFAGSLLNEGAAYVFRGGPLGITATTQSDAYVRLHSGQSEATRRLNRHELDVAGLGDVNNDGFSDVALGLGFLDAGELNEGAVFVYHGGTAPINPNLPPVAIAGDDQIIIDIEGNGSATFTADGSLSFDPDGSIVAYEWREGETVLGTSPLLTTALPTTGNHSLVLTVTDDNGLTRGDQVIVKISTVETPMVGFDNFSSGGFAGGLGWSADWIIGGDVSLSADTFPTPPQARIGVNATLSRSIILPPGSTSILLKFWAKASQFGPSDQVAVQVSRDGGIFTTLKTFTTLDSNDNYQFYGGTVGDGRITLSWFPDTATNMVLRFVSSATTGLLFVDDIEVRAIIGPPGAQLPPPGELPVANAGIDISVDDTDGNGVESVILDGSLSTDPDGTIVSYQWFEQTELNGPILLGTGANLTAPFTVGSHTVRLIVTDNEGGSASDTMTVTINPVVSNNLPPIANAGSDQTIIDIDGNTLEIITFDGTASTDPDGNIVSYTWRKNGNLYNNAATFSITESIGVHTIELTVTDNQGATSTDTVIVTVEANTPLPSIDSLSAIPGATSGEFILIWSTTNATSVSIDNGVGAVAVDGNATVNPTTTTTYTLTATGTGGSTTSNVTVTVNPPPPGPPTVDGFTASPATITAGVSTSLNWTTTGADSVSIDNGSGTGLVANGSITVTPTTTTTYTLTATGPGGVATLSVTVTVSAGPSSTTTTTVTGTLDKGGSNAHTVTILGAGLVDAILSYDRSRANPVLTVFDPNNTQVATLGGNSPIQVSFMATISGDYVYRIDNLSNKRDTDYTLAITYPTGAPPPTPPTLTSISVGPAITSIQVEQTQPFTATGNFSDGNTADLTTTAAWFSSTAAVATINASGLASGAGAGTTNISASVGGITSNVATLTVTAPPPSSQPTVDTFTISPTIIASRDSTTLTWTTTGATSVDISGVTSGLPADGSVVIGPQVTTTYTLTANGAGGSASSSVTVTVIPRPVVDTFTAAPASITEGASTTLSWTTTDADSVTINGGPSLLADGSIVVTPTVTTTYLLVITGVGGSTTATVTLTVNPASPGAPAVDSFDATPTSITAGGSATLSWTTTNADSVSINGGASLPANGSSSVSPTTTTSYVLTTTGPGGTATSSVTITVDSAPTPPPTTETISVSQAEFRADKNEWRIDGTAGPGNTLTLYIGSTTAGTILGTTAVDSLGAWEFREDSPLVPDGSGTISIQSSAGGILEGISVSIR